MSEGAGEFADRVVLITGGASGIGAETARRFAAAGARVLIADLDQEAAERLAAELPGAAAYQVDVADADSVEALRTAVEQDLGRLDVLLHGAYHAGDEGESLLSSTVDQLRLDLEATLLGPMLVSRALLPLMISTGGGVVLAIGSVNGLGWYGGHGYSTAKAGLLHFTRTLAADFAEQGVRANAVAPGTVETPAWADAKAEDPGLMERMGSRYPLGRVGQPGDIADALLFLASDRAAWITGTVLPIEGGILLTNRLRGTRE
ncbi:SDR family NAD(P)-dependent oxidoreductase [Enemella evansiae]|uniref:SDR family NAD(P)-dependent oxidoreductase n=1 Tax=Enemella evansiae TaxID=2016499 RepID=UPI000B978894|nr:SDR family oxidoreductase [Enemella evansiae]OYO13152.1 oxidoreductase [Enemella evansiae]TDO94030.1 NAD(P)-dependent dehydrogenase (short-subunit alcohol dehydrogenase family) [Enemella evansiae]